MPKRSLITRAKWKAMELLELLVDIDAREVKPDPTKRRKYGLKPTRKPKRKAAR